MGDYSDALRFEPISPYTHCLEEDEEDQEGQFDFNTNQWKEGLDEENQADLT